MNEQPMETWEARLSRLAAGFPYPETPDVAGAVSRRLNHRTPYALRHRLAWALVLLCVLLGSLLAVPPVRAAVLEFLQIGAVRIFLPAPAPTATPAETSLPAALSTALPPSTAIPSSTPRPTPTPAPLHLAGETTLAEAQAQLDFPIRLPAHPPDLGAPDRVFLQDRNGPLLILVWMEPEQPEQVRLALYQLGPGVQASKGSPPVIAETTVGGERAVWVEGYHMLQIEGDQYDVVRLVGDNVLVWTQDENGQEVTYRLETGLPLEEAVRVAESLE